MIEHAVDSPCPNCGYCPTCGRSRPVTVRPWPYIYPQYPWGTYPGPTYQPYQVWGAGNSTTSPINYTSTNTLAA